LRKKIVRSFPEKKFLEILHHQAAKLETIPAEDEALLDSIHAQNQADLKKADDAFGKMLNFIGTMRQFSGAESLAKSCVEITCGPNAWCDDLVTDGSITCKCEEGYSKRF
jgi:hypothetical protein